MWDKLPRLVRTFTPFLLLVVAVLLYRAWGSAPAPEVAPTAVPPARTAPSSPTGVPTAVLLATDVAAAETAVPTPSPLPPGPLVHLAGPPAAAAFPLTAPLSFYWTANYVPLEGQRFEVVIIAPGGETVVGGVESPNLGQTYQVRATPAELGLGPGEHQWIVRLADDIADAALWQSTARPLRFLEHSS